MQPANHWKQNLKKKSNNIVWLTAFFLAVLVIATVSVVGSCLYHYAHRSDCQISLYEGQIKESTVRTKNAASQKAEKASPVIRSQAVQYSGARADEETKQSAFEVDDAVQVWKTETAIELFKAEYKNADNTVTVKSADGSKVIAPGTEGSYTFSLKNNSDSAADYKIWVDAKLSSNMTGVPIETRMSGANGWLLGGKNTWEQASALNGVSTAETIGAGRTAEYTIYWQWPFEQEKDAFDTELGDASAAANQEMSYTVTIYTLTATAAGAAESDDQDTQNPVNRFVEAVKTGDDTPIFMWMTVLIASAGIFLFLFIAKRRKNDKKNEQNNYKEKYLS